MAGPRELPTERAVFRYYRDLGDAALDTLYLNMADFLAARGPLLTADEMAVQARVIAHILEVGPQKPRAELSGRRGLLTGHDIMSELSLGPGPLVGRLLAEVAKAEADGLVSTRTEALSLARNYLEAGVSSG
jgi:poly(A) polymerase